MNKPNLFEIGTKELAQDALLTWLISYADNQYIEKYKELNTLAKDFIKMMVGNNNLNIEKYLSYLFYNLSNMEVREKIYY